MTDVRKEVCFGLVELRQLLVRVAELAVCLGDFGRSLFDASLEFIVPPAQFSRLPAFSHAGLALHASQKADANARCDPDKLPRQAAAVGDVEMAENEIDEDQSTECGGKPRPHAAERRRNHYGGIKAEIGSRGERFR